MASKKRRKQKSEKFDDRFLQSNTVTSTTECTGLIPSLPVNEGEAESYSDLYGIVRQEVDE
jgi:hypothetical protein